MFQSQSTMPVEQSRSRNSIQHYTSCRSLTSGADAPRTELCDFETAFYPRILNMDLVARIRRIYPRVAPYWESNLYL